MKWLFFATLRLRGLYRKMATGTAISPKSILESLIHIPAPESQVFP
jgi:hypothetical protein